MPNLTSIEDIVNQLMNALPPGLNTLPKNLKDNFKIILTNALKRLDIVPREEFDTQLAVLKKSRKRLEALEKRITELETKQQPK